MKRTLFNPKYFLYSFAIQGICTQTVKAGGGKSDNAAVSNAFNRRFNNMHIWLVWRYFLEIT
jgi:hypothetical protein